jgi:hypothetical protein
MTPTTMTPTTMTPTTMTPTTATADVALCWVYSHVMRDKLSRYRLKPKQFWLAHVLVLESYDRLDESGAPDPIVKAPLCIDEWAKRGRFEDEKGLRRKSLEAVLESLVGLGIVDVNWIERTFELRPAVESSGQLTELRARATRVEGESQRVLELCAERPVSAALADLSREKALVGAGAAVSGASALFSRPRQAVNDPTEMAALEADLARTMSAPNSAEKSAESIGGKIRRTSAEKSADTGNGEKPADLQGFAASAEKSAERPQLAAAAVPVQPCTKLAKLAGNLPAFKAAAASSSEGNATEAMAYLLQIDQGHDSLKARAEWAVAWTKISLEHSDWVLGRFRKLIVKRNPDDPIAFGSRVARDDGIWPGCRARPYVGERRD